MNPRSIPIRPLRRLILLLALIAALPFGAGLLGSCALFRRPNPVAFDHGHTAWAQVLARVAAPEGVRYAALAENSADLEKALDEFRAVGGQDYERFDKRERLAFLINLHNALAMREGLKRWRSGTPRSAARFVSASVLPSPSVRAAGRPWTLKKLRKAVKGREFEEGRAAFALNGARRDQPPLALVPYTSLNLETALEIQTREFIQNPAHNRYDFGNRVFYASRELRDSMPGIERQYTSMHSFIRRFSPPADQEKMKAHTPRIVYQRRDRDLNAAE